VLKDNEEKNSEIVSLNLEIWVQQVKNESLFTGVKTANDEVHKNELQLQESQMLISQLKALTVD
jgi:hypothetical protein